VNGRGSSATAGAGSAKSHSEIASGPIQDLMGENLLMSAPRTTFNGHECPSLGGIPLLRKLGQGGMGAVYYGVHPRLSIEVAVKVLPYHLVEKDPLLVERFFREAQISAQVRSPHLVNVMDVNEESGVFFLVMEYVNGMSGKERLAVVTRSGAKGMTELEALEICVAASTGLEDAHARGIIHRDIKPENIMIPYVSRTTKELNVNGAKLMDLGLARADTGTINNPALTATKQAMGTPGYMAPEQIMDARTAGPTSDVFSMGASLYAMLAGVAPFKRKNSMQTLMATMNAPHTPLIQERPDVSEQVSAIVDNCLAKEISGRYPDAHHLLVELKRALKHARAEAGVQDLSYDSGTGTASIAKPHEGGELPAIHGLDESESATAPKAASKSKTIPRTTMYIGAAAALAFLVAGIFWLKQPNPEQLQSHERMLLRALEKAGQPELAHEIVRNAGEMVFSDPRPKLKEAAVDDIILVQEKLKKETIDFDDINMKLTEAEKYFPTHARIVELRGIYDIKKSESTELILIKKNADALESILANPAGDFALAGDKLKMLELRSERIKNGSMSERVKGFRKKLNEIAAKDVDERNRKIKAVAGLLADAKSDLRNAEQELSDLERLFPKEPEVLTLRPVLAQRKETVRKQLVDGVFVQIADAKVLAVDLEAKVADLEKKYPADADVASLRQKLVERSGQEAENKRLAKVTPSIEAFDAAIVGDKPDLVKASAALTVAEQSGARLEELEKRKTALVKLQGLAARNKAFADASELMRDATSDRAAIKSKLDALEKMYSDDPEIATLRSAYTEREKRAADARIARISVPMNAARAALDDTKSDLKAAQKKLDEAKSLGATDAELASIQGKLTEAIAAREKYAADFKSIEKLLSGSAPAADIEKEFAQLQATYPGDTELTAIGARVSARKQRDEETAEADRKKRITPMLSAAASLLSGPGGDMEKGRQKLREAALAGATLAELEPGQKALSRLTQRHDDIKSVSDLLASKTSDLADIEAQYKKLSEAYTGDTDVAALKTQLEDRKQLLLTEKENMRKGRVKILVDLADKLIVPDVDLADAKKNIDDARKAGATEVELAAVQKKLGNEEFRREKSAKLLAVTKALNDETTPLSKIEDMLKPLEVQYKDDAEVRGARLMYATRKQKEDDAVAAKVKTEEQQRLAKLKEEQDRIARLQAEQARAAKLKDDQETAAKLKAEQDRVAKLKLDEDRLAKVKAEQETAAKLKAEQDQAAKQKLDEQRAAQFKIDEDRKKIETAIRQKFDGFISSARTSISAKDFSAAETQLREAERLVINDPLIPALRRELEIRKTEATRVTEVVEPKKKTPPPPENTGPRKKRRIGEEDVD